MDRFSPKEKGKASQKDPLEDSVRDSARIPKELEARTKATVEKDLDQDKVSHSLALVSCVDSKGTPRIIVG